MKKLYPRPMELPFPVRSSARRVGKGAKKQCDDNPLSGDGCPGDCIEEVPR